MVWQDPHECMSKKSETMTKGVDKFVQGYVQFADMQYSISFQFICQLQPPKVTLGYGLPPYNAKEFPKHEIEVISER